MSHEGPLLLTTEQAARLLGVPASTLAYWARLGRGPRAVRIGRFRRYRRIDIEAWVESQFTSDGHENR